MKLPPRLTHYEDADAPASKGRFRQRTSSLDSAARCAPRGFWGETPVGSGRRAAAAVGERDADEITCHGCTFVRILQFAMHLKKNYYGNFQTRTVIPILPISIFKR
ncbi:unnamed protein product [Rangifer tarandus platyrhynchus]|uniref:Uncharacterized protein n=1 Tax=Rangifer tarandus platyrhynchus TaxID=3082113 RepID=A0AC59ZJM8_RANTA